MSHVTDGELHAYLDGALDRMGLGSRAAEVRGHLESCAECQARLSDEREVRDRTKEILAGSGPDALHMPPFEEIRARAMAPAPKPVGQTRSGPPRGWGLAWAASVVLALGLGWAGRDLGWRGADFSQAPNSEMFETAPAASAPADPTEIDAVSDAEPVGAGEDALQLREDGQTGAFSDRALQTSGDVTAQDNTPAQADAPGRSAPTTVGSAASRDQDAVEREERTSAAENERLRANAAQAPPPAPATEQLFRRSPEADRAKATEEPRAADERAAAGNRAREVGAVLEESDLAADANANAAVFLAVPDLPVLSVTMEDGALLVRQELPDGGVLELRYAETAPVGEYLETLDDRVAGGRTESTTTAQRQLQKVDAPTRVVRPHGDGWLVATAPISAEDLERLLDRIP